MWSVFGSDRDKIYWAPHFGAYLYKSVYNIIQYLYLIVLSLKNYI